MLLFKKTETASFEEVIVLCQDELDLLNDIRRKIKNSTMISEDVAKLVAAKKTSVDIMKKILIKMVCNM